MTEQHVGNEKKPSEEIRIEGVADRVDARDANIENSLVGVLQASGHAKAVNSISLAMAAGQNLDVAEGLSGAFIAGGNVAMKGSFGVAVVAGANADMHGSNAGFLNCQQATVESSTIGVLLVPKATLGENVKVMITTQQAIAFGAAFGLVAGIFGLLFRRRR